MKDRATRRAALERKKKKARKIYRDHPKADQYANHMAKCSCSMCGNPRKFRKGTDKLTLQERKNEENQD